MIFLLIWFQVIEEQGVRYHHLSTHTNETLCMDELRHASVLVNDKTEAIECIGVKIDD
jgi:hypothetical protein